MIQIAQDDQRNGGRYNLRIGRRIYCRLYEEVYPADAIPFTQNLEFTTDTGNDFTCNKEQFKNVPWCKGIDPLNSRNPDRNAWVDEGEGEVDYQ